MTKIKPISEETRNKMRLARLSKKRPGFVPWNKGTRGACKPNSTSFKKGRKPHNFKGWYRSKEGYIFIYFPEHPFATGEKFRKTYVMEHRLVMEKNIGRYLKSDEIVHHINEKRDDNRIQNLRLCKNNAEHKSFHRKQYKFKKQCSWCKKVKSLKNFYKRKGQWYSWCYPCIWQKRKKQIIVDNINKSS